MAEEFPPQDDEEIPEPSQQQGGFDPTGLAIGVGVGVALGAALDNLGVGIALGAGIGAALSVAMGHRQNRK